MSAMGKDVMEPGFAASEIDTSRPHPARMYDAYLGGRDNYPVDREAVREILRLYPETRPIPQRLPGLSAGGQAAGGQVHGPVRTCRDPVNPSTPCWVFGGS